MSAYRTWGVRDPDGNVHVYGDQEYVRTGDVLADHPGGEVVVCDVEIRAGGWRAPVGGDGGFPVFSGLKRDGE